MRVLLLALVCCSSKPELNIPPQPDAGGQCDECWAECGQAMSWKAAWFCSIECNEICRAEGRR